MRKEAGFEIADHIISYYEGGEYVEQVMKDYEDYIKHETLSDEIKQCVPAEGVHAESYKINGYEMRLGVVKVLC
jgi:isoleucyl-tRNA synthetase